VFKKKVCMLGAFAVGKTSLTRRFVEGMFSDKYLSTVGVKVNKKTFRLADREVALVIWDVAGESEVQQIRPAYLRGLSGYVLVADMTRPNTLQKAQQIHERVVSEFGELPFLMVFNKSDLVEERAIEEDTIESLTNAGWPTLETSAKTGQGVETAFTALAEAMLEQE